MDYVQPPFCETRSVVLARERPPMRFTRWADLEGKDGLTVVNNSFGGEFDRFMRERLKLTRVASLEQALRMLEIGRGDYLLYEDSPAQAYIASLNIKGLKELAPPVAQERLYLTLSHQSACRHAAAARPTDARHVQAAARTAHERVRRTRRAGLEDQPLGARRALGVCAAERASAATRRERAPPGIASAPRGPPWAGRCCQAVLGFRAFRFAAFCRADS